MRDPLPTPILTRILRPCTATCAGRLAQVIGTDHDVLILSGEGLLGLEAAVCSLVEPGMKVLCIANGHFGEGFGRFVEIYGGNPCISVAPMTM